MFHCSTSTRSSCPFLRQRRIQDHPIVTSFAFDALVYHYTAPMQDDRRQLLKIASSAVGNKVIRGDSISSRQAIVLFFKYLDNAVLPTKRP